MTNQEATRVDAYAAREAGAPLQPFDFEPETLGQIINRGCAAIGDHCLDLFNRGQFFFRKI